MKMKVVHKVDIIEELKRLERGQRTTAHLGNLAAVIRGILESGCSVRPAAKRRRRPAHRDDVKFLERLYRLEDTRE